MAAVSLFWDTNMAAVTSCENTLYLLKNLALMRCGPSLVKLLAELVIWRLFVSYKSEEGHHRKSRWKNYTNVDINDISKVLLMVIDLMPTISFPIRAVATIFDRMKWNKTNHHSPKSRMKPRKSQKAPFSHPLFGGGGGGVQIFHLFCPRLYWMCQRIEIVVTLISVTFIAWKHWSVTQSQASPRPDLLYPKTTFLHIVSRRLEKGALEHGITRKKDQFCDRVKRTIKVISQGLLDCGLFIPRWNTNNYDGAPFDRQRQYAAPQFPHPLSSGKSGQFFEEPSQETLESQTPHRSGALCHLHKLLFP